MSIIKFAIYSYEQPARKQFMDLNNVIAVYLLVTMTEQQGTPDQLPAEKGQGGAGATYKVVSLS